MSKPRDTLRSDIGTFVMLPTWVLDRVTDANAVHAYAVIARHANHERRAWPGQDRIARMMGASVSTVQRAVRVLRDAGVIETEARRENGIIVGTDYILLAKHHASPVKAGAVGHDATAQDVAVGQVTNDDTRRQTYTSEVTAHNKERTRSIELDPKNTYADAGGSARLQVHAATIFAEYRLGWEQLYKQPVSLISSGTDLYKIQEHLKTLGLERMQAALAGYFKTSHDQTVRRARHRLGLFLVSPSTYLVDEVQHVEDARTGDERRRHTQQANALDVAGQGRLAHKLDEHDG